MRGRLQRDSLDSTRLAICFCFNAARDLFQSKRKRVFSHLNTITDTVMVVLSTLRHQAAPF